MMNTILSSNDIQSKPLTRSKDLANDFSQRARRFSRFYILFFLLIAVCYASGFAQNTQLSVEVEPSPLAGNPFRVTYKLNDKGHDFKLGSLDPNLKVVVGPSVSSGSRISMINGNRKASSFTSYTYMFMVEKEGEYKIPSASVRSGGKTYSVSTQSVKVFSSNAEGGQSLDQDAGVADGRKLLDLNKGVFIQLIISKKNLYEQEGFLASFKIYSQYDIRFKEVKFPEFDGFLVQDLDQNNTIQLKPEQYNGKIYLTGVLKQSFLIPQRSGTLTIPSGKFEMLVSIPKKQADDGFDGFLSDFFSSYQEVPKTIISQPTKVKVNPLPSPKPDDFNGAVGSFTMKASAPNSVVKAGESYKIKLSIKGSGNIRLLEMPSPQFPNTFESYDPQESSDISVTQAGASGTKETEFFAVPRTPGDYTIPPISFSYFDPSSKRYQTLKTQSFRLHVDKGDGTETAPVSNFTQKQDVQVLGNDIRYLKSLNSFGTSMPKLNILNYLLVYVGLIIILFVLFLFLRSRRKEKSNLAVYKSKKASKVAKRWLSSASKSLKRGEDELYYETLLKGLTDYLSSKLHLPMSSWSKETACEILASKMAPEPLCSEVNDVLSELEFSRYTHNPSIAHKERLYERSADIIDHIENLKLK